MATLPSYFIPVCPQTLHLLAVPYESAPCTQALKEIQLSDSALCLDLLSLSYDLRLYPQVLSEMGMNNNT